mmetsp:Transcript_126096/g.315113  ORF Transcript_126096/g.315113 Transcript_126096/m.315113 type:complete len:225 (+) Transcript_126096:2338-3012(+)
MDNASSSMAGASLHTPLRPTPLLNDSAPGPGTSSFFICDWTVDLDLELESLEEDNEKSLVASSSRGLATLTPVPCTRAWDADACGPINSQVLSFEGTRCNADAATSSWEDSAFSMRGAPVPCSIRVEGIAAAPTCLCSPSSSLSPSSVPAFASSARALLPIFLRSRCRSLFAARAVETPPLFFSAEGGSWPKATDEVAGSALGLFTAAIAKCGAACRCAARIIC